MKPNSFSNILAGMTAFAFVILTSPPTHAAQLLFAHYDGYQDQIGIMTWIGEPFEALADSIAPDSTGMDTLTSVEFAQKLVPGWNVGNSLEAIGGETAWGNPLISQRLIDSVKAAGFRSIRIPVAWSRFTDTLFTIDTTWLARVEQVVNYVLNDSMYAIINEHWDGGWQQPTSADSAYVNHRLAVMWKQIAIRFRNYDDHLLFAGMNEVAVTNDYGYPSVEHSRVQNSFVQTFVNAVRSTGGRNIYRYLLVQGYRTDINAMVGTFVIPTDAVPKRLIVEAHYYDPYDFTINSSSSIIEWGTDAHDPSKMESWANEGWADGQFQKMKAAYVDHGYGVAMGEYAAQARLNLGSPALNAIHAAYRLYYMQYITRSMERHGLVPYYWDNGYTGDNACGIFNRSTGAQAYPDIISAIVDTSNVITVVGVSQTPSSPGGFFLGQNYPNPFNPSTTISYRLPVNSYVTLTVYDILGTEVTKLVKGKQIAGVHSVNFDGSRLTSGVYFFRLQAGSFVETRKLVLLK